MILPGPQMGTSSGPAAEETRCKAGPGQVPGARAAQLLTAVAGPALGWVLSPPLVALRRRGRGFHSRVWGPGLCCGALM